jgi:hypothetical protein
LRFESDYYYYLLIECVVQRCEPNYTLKRNGGIRDFLIGVNGPASLSVTVDVLPHIVEYRDWVFKDSSAFRVGAYESDRARGSSS